MTTLLDGLQNKYPDSADLVNTIRTNHAYIFDAKELDEQYKFFKNTNGGEIETDFHRENNFKTSMRGIKIRGVFDSVDEAKSRSEFINRYDNKFDIYICQSDGTGCFYMTTISTTPYVFDIPSPQDTSLSYMLKVIDNNNCVYQNVDSLINI